MRTHFDQVAPGVHRFADSLVNIYVINDGGALTVVDAGLPALYPAFEQALAGIGGQVDAIRAVLITHGHPDHMGMAQRLQAESGATVWIHELDQVLLAEPRRTMKHSKSERSFVPYLLRRPRAAAVPLHLARAGGFRESAVGTPSLFRGGETLDVPGSPLVLATPGHTRGSASFCFPSFGVVATGDALVTADAMTGSSGPRIVSRAFTHDSARALASLDVFAGLDVAIGLPGHGEPIMTGVAEAASSARSAGPS